MFRKLFGAITLGGVLVFLAGVLAGGEYANMKQGVMRYYCGFEKHYSSARTYSHEGTELLAGGKTDQGLARHAMAVVHYKALHDCGLPEGTAGLGLAYCHGYGVEKQPALGRKLLREAAAGNPEFMQFAQDDRFCFGTGGNASR